MHALAAVALIQPGNQERDGLGVAARSVVIRGLEHYAGLAHAWRVCEDDVVAANSAACPVASLSSDSL